MCRVPMICKIKHLFYHKQLQVLFILNYIKEKLVMAEKISRSVDFMAFI